MLSAGGPEVMVVSGGVVSTVHEYVAGVGSVLPAASRARTWKVWLPSARPVYAAGLVQPVKAVPSMEHWKDAPASELKSNVALESVDGLSGIEAMVVSGGVVSTVQEYVAGLGSVLPAVSLARTWKLWLPSVRLL